MTIYIDSLISDHRIGLGPRYLAWDRVTAGRVVASYCVQGHLHSIGRKKFPNSPRVILYLKVAELSKNLLFLRQIFCQECVIPPPPYTHTHHFLSSPIASNLVSCYYYSLHFFEGLHLPAKRFLSVLQQPCCLCRIPSRNHFFRDTVLVVIQTNSSVHRIGTRMATRGDLFKSIKNYTMYGLQTIQYFGSKL